MVFVRHRVWRARWLLGALVVGGLLGGLARAADWFDDFEDGKVDDGNPVAWTPHDFFPGDYFVDEGDFHLTGAVVEDDNENLFAFVGEAAFEDTSVRAQGVSEWH